MKRAALFFLIAVFCFNAAAFAEETNDGKKLYLDSMNKILIEAEEAMRNLSMKFSAPNIAAEQFSSVIKKFEALKSPAIFLEYHDKMLLSFKTIAEGLKLLSEGEREKAGEIVRNGAGFLKEAALGMRSAAEKAGLIPVRPDTQKDIKAPSKKNDLPF